MLLHLPVKVHKVRFRIPIFKTRKGKPNSAKSNYYGKELLRNRTIRP